MSEEKRKRDREREIGGREWLDRWLPVATTLDVHRLLGVVVRRRREWVMWAQYGFQSTGG